MTPIPNGDCNRRIQDLRQDFTDEMKANRDRVHELRAKVEAVPLLLEIQKRQDAALIEHDMRIAALERSTVDKDIAVLKEQLGVLKGWVKGMTLTFATLSATVVAGIVTYIFTQ